MKTSSASRKSRGMLLLAAASLLPGLALGAVPAQAAEKTYGYTDADASFVPLRALKQLPGVSVSWDAGKGTAEIVRDGSKAVLTIGNKEAVANGEKASLNRAPFLENGAAYVPLSFLSKQFGIGTERLVSANAVSLSLDGEKLRLPLVPRGAFSVARKPIVIESKTVKAAGRSFSVQAATVSLMDPRVDLEVAVAGGKAGRTEELAAMAKRGGAVLAVNGAFFDAYTDSSVKNPYGYLFNGGQMLYKSSGDKKTVVAFDSNMLTELLSGAEFEARYRDGGVDGAVQAGPRLLKDGVAAIDPKAEGFRDPKILTGGGSRSALGLTPDHKLIIVTTGGATIPQLAAVMKSLGAWQAMNLDGGASSGLYYDGKYLTRPGRLLSNALMVRLVK